MSGGPPAHARRVIVPKEPLPLDSSPSGARGTPLFYGVVRLAFRGAAAIAFSLRVEGAERFPASGPAIVVAPHRSWLDPPCLGAASRRPVRFLIIDRVYDKPWARWFYRRMGSVPVRPGGRAALRAALRLVESGELVGVFPEGRIVRDEGPAVLRPGAALLSVRTGAPVVPVAIAGTARAWPPGRRWPRPAPVTVRVGEPIDPTPDGRRLSVEDMLDRIEAALGGATSRTSPSGDRRGPGAGAATP
jgi:1-acyl-sn-glycerol-3-phosphate acyltransferase